MEHLILGFLLRNGHVKASKALLSTLPPGTQTSPSNEGLLKTLESRAHIQQLIQTGEITQALKHLDLHFPAFTGSPLSFSLHIQIMLEYLRAGNAMQALEYVQQTLLPLTVDSPARHQELSTVVGVLAYEDIPASPFAHRFEEARRVELAAAVTEELCKAVIKENAPLALEDLIRHAFLVHKELGKKDEFICRQLVSEK